ncbi:ExeA family protein [Ramlibacter sp.]|uniref:ExeA family protein n=1 Tax=Ramlibacter sp. TaxID=1917967 RepID=UPI003D13AF97
MYAAYFGLRQEPFSIAPDPRLLFMSERHREALAHLLYGLGGGGGFVLLTGEIGTGKTTVVRCFTEQVPANCNLAYIFNPKLTVLELLETVCHEFGIDVAPLRHGTVKDFVDTLNAYLLDAHAAGRNNVLVIDEAQNLSPDVLEQLRLLTNLETTERKLLQIILVGQPELREMLARPELEQLAQRVIARYHLQALSENETAQYIRHRMEVCGLKGPLPFDRRALKRVHEIARGVPRRINLLCDRALLGAFASEQTVVGRAIVDQAAREVFDEKPPRSHMNWLKPAFTLSLGLAAGAGLWAAVNRVAEMDAPAAVRASQVPASGAVAARVASSGARTAAVPGPFAVLREIDAAWRELAPAWKVKAGDGDPCSTLAREQVQCWFPKPTPLALIRQLGRPGIVTLDAASGQPSYAILVGLTDTQVTLRAGGGEQTLALAAFGARWQGDFATLWKAPPGYVGRMEDDATGTTVDWVAASLAKAKGVAPRKTPARLSPALKADVREFQLAQNLPADGRPGPLTYMQLNRATGIDEPRLRTEP